MYLLEENLHMASLMSNGTVDLVEQCQRICREAYPQLSLRWARIYGRRWAHLCGGNQNPVYECRKVKLNQHFGICIDNPGDIGQDELERLINLLREVFACEPAQCT